jgi:hypothetical protein
MQQRDKEVGSLLVSMKLIKLADAVALFELGNCRGAFATDMPTSALEGGAAVDDDDAPPLREPRLRRRGGRPPPT